MLSVEALESAYGDSRILFGIDLAVDAGEVVTLLGRNGMGKTTTVKSIFGLLKPRAGRILVDGEDVTGRPPHVVAKRGLGLVPEGRQIFPTLTGSRKTSSPPIAAIRARARPNGRCRISTGCFPGLRSAAATWATSSRAANSRCWPSAGR